MHHLVGEGVLHVAPARDLVRADQDAGVGAEAAALAMDLAVLGQARGTPGADDVGGVDVAVQRGDLLAQENHGGRVLQDPVPPLLAGPAVALLVRHVPRLAVVEDPLGRHGPRHDLEVVYPPLCPRVEAGALRVVCQDAGELGRICGGCRGRGRGRGW